MELNWGEEEDKYRLENIGEDSQNMILKRKAVRILLQLLLLLPPPTTKLIKTMIVNTFFKITYKLV